MIVVRLVIRYSANIYLDAIMHEAKQPWKIWTASTTGRGVVPILPDVDVMILPIRK